MIGARRNAHRKFLGDAGRAILGEARCVNKRSHDLVVVMGDVDA